MITPATPEEIERESRRLGFEVSPEDAALQRYARDLTCPNPKCKHPDRVVCGPVIMEGQPLRYMFHCMGCLTGDIAKDTPAEARASWLSFGSKVARNDNKTVK